jgi:PEP-CTERM motif
MTTRTPLMTVSLFSAAFLLAFLVAAPAALAATSTGGSIIFNGGATTGPPTTYSGAPIPIEIVSMDLTSPPTATNITSLPVGGEVIIAADSFFDVFTELSVDGQTFAVDSFFDITFSIANNDPPGTSSGTWDTEIVSMDLTVQIPGGPTIQIRESPTLPSPGQLAITSLPVGGEVIIAADSFFDVFTELSVDGGATWTPADGPMHLVMDAVVPEPGTAAMFGLALAGALVRRRARRAA